MSVDPSYTIVGAPLDSIPDHDPEEDGHPHLQDDAGHDELDLISSKLGLNQSRGIYISLLYMYTVQCMYSSLIIDILEQDQSPSIQ